MSIKSCWKIVNVHKKCPPVHFAQSRVAKTYQGKIEGIHRLIVLHKIH